jgi:hypothetical protein
MKFTVLSRALASACITVLLLGCTPAPTKLVYEHQNIPEYLLVCQPEPVAPAVTTQSDQSVLIGYTIAALVAGQDCRDKLAAVKQAVGVEPAGGVPDTSSPKGKTK